MLALRQLSSTNRLAASSILVAILATGCSSSTAENLFDSPGRPDATAAVDEAGIGQDSSAAAEAASEQLPEAAAQTDAEPLPYDAGGGSKPFAQSDHPGKIAWFQLGDANDLTAFAHVNFLSKWSPGTPPADMYTEDTCAWVPPSDTPLTGDPDVQLLNGGAVHILGTSLGPITLNADSLNLYENLPPVQTNLFNDYDPISIESTGSQDMPPVQIAGVAPARIAGLSPNLAAPDYVYNDQEPLSLSWTPAGGDFIVYWVFCSGPDPQAYGYASCYSYDTGQWTMPAGVAEYIKNAGCPGWRVQMARWNEVQVQADGVTVALTLESILDSTNPEDVSSSLPWSGH